MSASSQTYAEGRSPGLHLRPSEEQQRAAALGTPTFTEFTWSTASGFKGLENDVVVLVGLKDIDDDWHQHVAYVGMSRARTRLDVIIREDCDEKRRELEKELAEKQTSDAEMPL